MVDGKFRTFEDLHCWKVCTELRRFVSDLTKTYPKEETYALSDDMRRAARSTTHNIAEGFGRFHYQENIQFCRQSRGSLYELLDQMLTSKDEGYISVEQYQKARALISKAVAVLNGYIRYLSQQKKEATGK